jgi:hypothetical protein
LLGAKSWARHSIKKYRVLAERIQIPLFT